MSDSIVVNITPPAPIELAYTQGGAVGPQGSVGPAGPPNVLNVGTVATTSATTAAVSISGTSPSQTISFVVPRGVQGLQGIQGEVGPAGPANSLSVGSVATTSAETASISITGTSPSQVISFVVPRGPQGIRGEVGPLMTVQVGGVTTSASGTNAKIDTVTSGNTVTLNFTIPRGADATANLADETPQPLGVASAGSALTAARADHVHAVGSVAYSSLSGIPSTFAPSSHQHVVADVTGLQTALDGKQAAGTYATLVGGTVPSSQLPSYVDDVIEYANLATFPSTNDGGKILVARDTGKIYRWSGSAYIEISPSPGSTDSVTEGSTNLYFTNVRAAAAAPVQSVAGRTGAVTLAQLASTGTASSTTFLRGDGAWAAAGSTSASDLTTGTLSSDRLPLATTSVAGAVIVGAGLAISSGVLSASGSDAVDGGDYVGEIPRTITITAQPANQTASSGAATFAVTATASPAGTPTYQWQKSDSSGFATAQRTLPASANWRAMAYGNGVFVALGYSSTIAATSADGVTWTQRTLPTNANWLSVTYGNGVFVAVANDSAIAATSADGITWTTRTLPTSAGWSSVTYGNGTFVAVANASALGAIAATSANGVTWTQRTLPTSAATWNSVTYGNGIFVAIASSAATSADGITWTQRTLPNLGQGASWYSVTYGNGTFVAVAYNSASAATSADGITWTTRTLPASAYWFGVAYGDNTFFAIASNSAIAATSGDGITWTQRTLAASGNWVSVAFGGNTFVAATPDSAVAVTITISGQTAFANISGATSSTLALTGLTNAADNLDRFRVVVSATGATAVTSNAATLTVN